jgi:hypothetical protein
MTQTYEYFTVDPGTWKDVRKLDTVINSAISRDTDAETRGSATFDISGPLDECYVRTYLATVQNGLRESTPLGTFLVQSPSTDYDGKITRMSVDAYTPLLELKEKMPPIGYSILKDANIMEQAYLIIRENTRAPVVRPDCDKTLSDDFVANTSDTWLTFVNDLVAKANYEIGLDELGRVIFQPIQKVAAMRPVWTYDDDNSSILYPEVSLEHDIYGIPNVVEVIYSNGKTMYYAKAVNDDPNSLTSTVKRGREIIYRDTNPSMSGEPTQAQIDEYAVRLLKTLSSVEYTITYTHGYCPVRVGDCIRLNYKKAGLTDIKAKVIRQTITCNSGCPVQETAVYTKNLWR